MKTIHRFFVPSTHFGDGKVKIWGDEGYHLIRILRAAPGMQIKVFTEKETEFLCEVVNVKKTEATAKILEKMENRVDPEVRVTVAQALVKPAKFDFIIQKCTELGVSAFQPVVTKHSISLPKQAEKQLKRWDRIALEALKQCEGRRIPAVYEIKKFEKFISEDTEGLKFYLDARDGEPANTALRRAAESGSISSVTVFIGPEGGFSDDEKTLLREKGFIPIYLGPRVLRAETAAVAITSILFHELD